MRTALILLPVLAVAAIPGSLLPQRNVNPEAVTRYLVAHRDAGPWLDRLGAFNVFASRWFSAVYLLLFTSLVGCLVPRARGHLIALARRPPPAPARLERIPAHSDPAGFDGDPATGAAGPRAVAAAGTAPCCAAMPTGHGPSVPRRGYLKETGNLLFHLSLLTLLIGVAYGSWFGCHANRIVVAGPEHAHCNTLQHYDEYGLGARVSPADMEPFCLQLDDFQAAYPDNGQPVAFTAQVTSTPNTGPPQTRTIQVNQLTGHRRRVWFRITPTASHPGPPASFTGAALARGHDRALADELHTPIAAARIERTP